MGGDATEIIGTYFIFKGAGKVISGVGASSKIITITNSVAASDSVDVVRWGRPGLNPGDWVMKGANTWLNYLRSCKWQLGMGNEFAPKSACEVFHVPEDTEKWP